MIPAVTSGAKFNSGKNIKFSYFFMVLSKNKPYWSEVIGEGTHKYEERKRERERGGEK